MKDKLRKLNSLINDAITISETTLDWKIKHGLIFSKSLSKLIIDLLRELGFLSCDYGFPPCISYQTDILAFVGLLRKTQENILAIQSIPRKSC